MEKFTSLHCKVLTLYILYDILRKIIIVGFGMEESEKALEFPLLLDKDVHGNDLIVFQANKLIRAHKDDLSLLEAKFLRLVISQIVKEDKDFKTYTCTASQLAKFFDISLTDVAAELRSIGDSLLKKMIYIENDKGEFDHFQWITRIRYAKGTITVRLNDALKDYLLGLDRLFTAYGYEVIMGFNSDRSIKLFELLSSYANMGIRDRDWKQPGIPEYVNLQRHEYAFRIEYLRSFFGCENKYALTRDFLKFVIGESLKIINRNTLINATYRTVRNGKRIEYVVFRVLTPPSEMKNIRSK